MDYLDRMVHTAYYVDQVLCVCFPGYNNIERILYNPEVGASSKYIYLESGKDIKNNGYREIKQNLFSLKRLQRFLSEALTETQNVKLGLITGTRNKGRKNRVFITDEIINNLVNDWKTIPKLRKSFKNQNLPNFHEILGTLLDDIFDGLGFKWISFYMHDLSRLSWISDDPDILEIIYVRCVNINNLR